MSSSTGTTVSAETRGNISLAPNLSVSAPAGTRPSEPTSTGTATSSDCWKELRSSRSLKAPDSGETRFHAQKVSVKPTVAVIRFRKAAASLRTGAGDCAAVVSTPQVKREGEGGARRVEPFEEAAHRRRPMGRGPPGGPRGGRSDAVSGPGWENHRYGPAGQRDPRHSPGGRPDLVPRSGRTRGAQRQRGGRPRTPYAPRRGDPRLHRHRRPRRRHPFGPRRLHRRVVASRHD